MLKKSKTLLLLPILTLLILFLVSGVVVSEVWAQECNCVCQDGTNHGLKSGPTECESLCSAGRYDCTPIIKDDKSKKTDDTKEAQLENPIGETSIPKIIGKVIQVILGLVGIISLIMFIYAGVVWLTAQGKSDAIKKGRDTMLWAVVGLLVVFGSYIILKFVFEKLTF